MPQAKNKNHNQAEAKAKSKVASIPVVKPPDSHQPQQQNSPLIQANSQNQQQGSSQLAPNSSTSNSEIKNQIHQNQISEQPEQLVQVVRQDLVLEDDEPSEIDSFVLDEQEEETGELSEDEDEEDDSRLDEDDLEDDSEDEDDLEDDEDDDEDDEEDDDEDEEDLVDENQRFLLRGAGGKDPDLDVVDGVVSAAAAAGAAGDIYPSVDPETHAKLEALFEEAGIGKLSGETKQFTDPEVLKRLTSSVSCALDEAAAALTRMRSDPPTDGKTLVDACNEGDFSKVRKLLDEGRVSVHDQRCRR